MFIIKQGRHYAVDNHKVSTYIDVLIYYYGSSSDDYLTPFWTDGFIRITSQTTAFVAFKLLVWMCSKKKSVKTNTETNVEIIRD